MSSPTLFPSFTLPASPTSVSSPTATQSSGGSSNNGTLYLYTFLATLVLLLAVSSAIVIRSMILRRRHQRLVEEAIRTGSWLPGRFDSVVGGRRRRDLSEKPKLWEVWLHPDDDHESEHVEHENAKAKWGDIMPVYATYVNEPTLSPQGPVTTPAETSVDRLPYPSRFLRPFTRRRSSPSPQPTSPVASQEYLPASSPTTSTSAVRVAVLIAMPSQPQKHGGDESGPPVIELGVAEADVKGDENERASLSRGDS